MGRIILLLAAVTLTTSCSPEFRCVNGVTYRQYSGGVWVEAQSWGAPAKCINDETERYINE